MRALVGMFLDPNSAVILFTPLLWPIAQYAGVDLIHFGIMMTVNLAIGIFSPPFGRERHSAEDVLRPGEGSMTRSQCPGGGGAGERNRTVVCSLGSCRSAIELHPRVGEFYRSGFCDEHE